MTIDEKLTAIRDVIQHDIGNRGLARVPERNLINACPDDFANACRSIAEHPSPSVAILTGFWIVSANPPCGETDGPLGTVYLARALGTLGVPVVIITDEFCRKPHQEGLKKSGSAATVLTAAPAAPTWTHLIAIERVGPASNGCCYTMRGRDITANMAPAHLMFNQPVQNGTRFTTIGIGDGGNEIGMGKIPIETIERNIPNGRQIACRVATDHLIVAGISNWGAYALAAGVALVRGQKLDPELFDPEREQRILQAMVERGPLVDGVTGKQTATVDGITFDDYIRPLLKIRKIAEM